ncbi:pseudouridine synthase [Clostridium tunisiense]|uniref:pseudouridine synthase n=1 Tax=Clostridium tunisiense TaxID=219748 RepID=UPI0003112DCA|nr:pseudouridine synthase [Clostridium tunisiense]
MEERLQKYMARCGVASRRKCEEIITSGRVKVDNIVVSELGAKIDCKIHVVSVNDKIIVPEENKVYIMLNKPEGYVSTVKDEKDRNTILDLVNVEERVYPIGRLDYDTSGLILLTNDGEVYNKIIHPRVAIDKVYIALVKGIPDNEKINRFEKGIDIGDYITAPGRCEIIKKYENSCELKIIIHEGKNRQVRRMCDAIGHPVIALKRVSIGSINLGSLPKGKWRFLSEKELEFLKSGGESSV